jgi:hypothetical protein
MGMPGSGSGLDVTDERPDFLPMFPWYSGTSADLYHTIFDVVVSVKLFLGRFDMRTMQVGAVPGRVWPSGRLVWVS